MLFAILKRCNVRVKWRSWQKELLKQVMIWQLQMQCTLGIHHFGGQLFIVVCCAKHADYFFGVDDKVGELFRWRHMVLIEINDVSSEKLDLQIFWTSKINVLHL